MSRTPVILLLLAALALAGGAAAVVAAELGGEARPTILVPGGDADRGRAAIERYGCAACHMIPDVPGPQGGVGPDLANFAERRYIAGDEPNAPAELERWIQDPQAVEPGTIMPDLGVSAPEARDIAAYLYAH